jgi:tetratricopeptide (TPR) repeat protein
LLANLTTAELGLERTDAVLANLSQALEIHIKLGDRAMIGNTSIDLSEAFRNVGRFEEAAEAARHGLAYLEADISAARARLLAALARTYSMAAAYEQAYEVLREALNIATQLSDPKAYGGTAWC